MKLPLLSGIKAPPAVRDIVTVALCGAILVLAQVSLAFIPNVELVSLLVILYTLIFARKVVYIIYVFVLAEGLIFGFGAWWFAYLYLWLLLAAGTWLCRRMESPLGWAVLSGAFGLFFGALSSFPYLVMGGPGAAVAYWVSGIPFDLVHCAGNFMVCLLLWKPLRRALCRIAGTI